MLSKNVIPVLSLAVLVSAEPVLAQQPPEPEAMEEVQVVDHRDLTRIDVADTVTVAADAATLLRSAPGANVNGNGPLTGIPQYRGMYGSRISVEVNGTTLSAGGPNWMDPPLSYAPAAQLESLEVYRGIAPVSAGQETIGGAINAKTWEGDFTESDNFSSSGRLRLGAQSVNSGSQASAAVVAANRHQRFKVSALTERADDADFPNGSIVPSEYQRERYDIGYGYTRNGHTLQLDFGRNETGDSGTAALPMDIQYIDADLGSLRYNLQRRDMTLEAKIFYSNIDHGMTNYLLREPPATPASWRRNIASSDNRGFKVSTRLMEGRNHWQFGVDGFSEQHNSDIDNPNNPMFFVVNFNDAERDVFGLFVERKQFLGDSWHAELGLRYNRVRMESGTVDGTPANMTMMGMSPGAMLRDSFNNAQRSRDDDNIDWVAKLVHDANAGLSYHAAIARKTRSPSYQERYLWLPLEATAGLADGRTYTGNLNLEPEVAHELELGMDYREGSLSLSPRVFYRRVHDYIQGTESSNSAAIQFVSMMNMMNGTSNPPPLEFNNVDAIFWGFDLDWRYALSANWEIGGLVNYVRGERDDISDNLYRIAPANMTTAITYRAQRWSLTAESALYYRQNRVSATNSEQPTAGYGLLNLRGDWQVCEDIRLGFGIDNVLDRQYRDHLAGYNRALNSDIPLKARLPGYGRNAFLRMDYRW